MSFDASEAGTSREVWAEDPRLRDLTPLRMDSIEEVLVVGAHPDDETLGAGGLIHRCFKAGVPIRVVCVTDGKASHPFSEEVVEKRKEELLDALEVLAPGTPAQFLGFPDGQAREYREEISSALSEIVKGVGDQVLIVAPWQGDGHRDHRVVGEIVQEIAQGRRVLEYPIWMWHWAAPDHADVPWGQMVSLAVNGSIKEEAIRSFESQTSRSGQVLREDFLRHFFNDQEVFIAERQSLPSIYFEAVYEKSDDPWRFRTRWYEQRKRDLTLAILPHSVYERGLEIGCAIGMLTEPLASRCNNLIAVDISARAVAHAQQRAGGLADIRVADALVEFPEGEFDLIVLSEVCYYWGPQQLRAALNEVRDHLATGGVLLACHWRHPVADYPQGGDDVHEMIQTQGWSRTARHVEKDFLLEVFSDDARSVAEREGLV